MVEFWKCGLFIWEEELTFVNSGFVGHNSIVSHLTRELT